MKITITLLFVIICSNLFAQTYFTNLVIKNVSVININTGEAEKPKDISLRIKLKKEFTNNGYTYVEKIIINGTGKFLMPAIYDMHVHFPVENAERFFNLQTAAGITTCRIMKSNDKTIAFAKTATNAPSMKIAYNIYGNETFGIDSISTLIGSLKARGYDFIKMFGVKDSTYFDAIMAAAKSNKIKVCGHALGKINAKKLLASGYKSIEHVGYFDKAKNEESLDSLIDLAVKNNVFVCPTLDWEMMAYHAINKDSFSYRAGYEIGKKLYANIWDTTYENTSKQFGNNLKQYKDYANNDIAKKIGILKKMRAKGLRIIAGSDAEEPYQTPGYSLIDELKLIQKAGYTNAELLQMVTTNAREYFSEKVGFKTTKTTRLDYILLSKNPLENIGNLQTVEYVIKGDSVIDVKKLLGEIK